MMAADDAEDFEGWVAPYLPRMALVAARLGPPSGRDDVLQEALLRAWRHRSAFDPAKGSAGGWLYTITANVARSHARGWRRLPAIATWEGGGLDPDEMIDLDAAISRLPRRQRLAVDCFYAVGLSVAETAQVMSCSEGTVKSTLADARSALRAALDSAKERGGG